MIGELNKQLDQYFSTVIEKAARGTKLTEIDDFPNLQTQVEGAVNKLNISVQRYNTTAMEMGRGEMIFELESEKSTPPKVKF